MPPSSRRASSRPHAALRSFLAAREDALPWAAARGYVAAVASMPSPPPPSRWMAGVVGTETPATAPELQRVVAELVHLLDESVVGLARGPLPLPADDAELAVFARGYLEASRLDRAWLEDDATLARLEDLERLTAAAAELSRAALADVVSALHARWSTAEVAPEEPTTPTRVGRNEPCPCGSGRKAKRCCG